MRNIDHIGRKLQILFEREQIIAKTPKTLSLAVAENFVEESAKLTLLAGEVEFGVVGQRLGQVQLDEPDQKVGQGPASLNT